MRLFWKVYLFSLSSVVLCAMLMTAIVTYRDAAHSLQRLRAEERLIAVTAASQVESGYHDQIWPFEMLSGIARDAEFVSWQVVDGKGAVVLSDRPVPPPLATLLAQVPLTPTEPMWTDLPQTDHEYWLIPLRMRDGKGVWQFRLGYHTASVKAQLHSTLWTNAVATLAIALLFIGLSLVITHYMLRPLNSLTGALTQMERGDMKVSLPRAGTDEIGQLVNGFAAMVGSIKERDVQIQEQLESLESARDDLESRVELRTLELVKAKAAAEIAALSLHESDTRMRAIIESAADAIITLDEYGNVQVFNPAAAAIFGYGGDDILGCPFETLLPAPYALMRDPLRIERSDEGGAALGSSAEIVGLRKDRSTFPMQISVTEVHLEGKKLFTAIVRDVTERVRAERENRDLHQRLVDASRRAGMAEVASDVLHNVGNVLNSVTTSAALVDEMLANSRSRGLSKVMTLLRDRRQDLGAYLTEDPRGKLVPDYLEKLDQAMCQERASMHKELGALAKDIDHIREIVRRQQSNAKDKSDVRESVSLPELVEDALRITGESFDALGIEIIRDYVPTPALLADRHKIIQILVNLVANARDALTTTNGARQIRVRIDGDATELRIAVIDSGVGISSENLERVFQHGFTTKPSGHGFGLHGSVLSAKAMGGSLSARSDGTGHGACFTLSFPLQRRSSTPIDQEAHVRRPIDRDDPLVVAKPAA